MLSIDKGPLSTHNGRSLQPRPTAGHTPIPVVGRHYSGGFKRVDAAFKPKGQSAWSILSSDFHLLRHRVRVTRVRVDPRSHLLGPSRLRSWATELSASKCPTSESTTRNC